MPKQTKYPKSRLRLPEKLPKTIDEVLKELDGIIDGCISENDARGIFAYVYRRTTFEVKKAIEAAEFRDSVALHRFDVAFANYYVRAYRRFNNDKECSLVWQESFNASRKRISVVQHILLGMNAHINVDLALTTAEQAKGSDIEGLKKDFLLMNSILARIVNELQDRLARVSPLLFLVDWLGMRQDEKIINFSMKKARQQAWNLAVKLHQLPPDAFESEKQKADIRFAKFAREIQQPRSPLLRFLLAIIPLFEKKNRSEIIKALKA